MKQFYQKQLMGKQFLTRKIMKVNKEGNYSQRQRIQILKLVAFK